MSQACRCSICGRNCHSVLKSRDICRSCHCQEPSFVCQRCGGMTHQLVQETGLCPRCTKVVTKPVATCSRCGQVKVIHNRERWLCSACRKAEDRRDHERLKQNTIECSICGKKGFSVLVSRPICHSCFITERNGYGFCSRCQKQKVIYKVDRQRGQRLCKRCDGEQSAPRLLQEYINNFKTLYPYNQVLFDLLVENIEWEKVTERYKQSIRYLGQFLQAQELPEPLTWEVIDKLMPSLESRGRERAKLLRSRWLDLGYLLVTKGQLESRETYQERSYALKAIDHLPERIQSLLRSFAGWLVERQNQPSTIRHYLRELANFWDWCGQQKLISPSLVQSRHISDYLKSLYWQWQCPKCHELLPLTPGESSSTGTCLHCGNPGNFLSRERYDNEAVRHIKAQLRVFFDWAKIQKLIISNPVRGSIAASARKISHYPFEVIEKLSQYIVNPQADPTEVLILYLIIFHALSNWELRHAKITDLLPLNEQVALPSLAQSYYIIIPKPPGSRGNRYPGRPRERLDFSPAAAAWLKPLLERFEAQRSQQLKNPNNQFLIIAPNKSRHLKPVSTGFIHKVVRRASCHAIQAYCNPKILRMTAAVMYADRAGGAILEWMGWGDQQAFFYSWGPRELINVVPVNELLET